MSSTDRGMRVDAESESLLTQIHRWYVGGAGPRVRGGALRERLIRTVTMAGMEVGLIALCIRLGGPWLSAAAFQDASRALSSADFGIVTAVFLFTLGGVLQFLAALWLIPLTINLVGLVVVSVRHARWARRRP